MDLEQREPVNPLEELHGRRIARVHLDGIGHTLPRDEVDAVESHEAELACDLNRQRRRSPEYFSLTREYRRTAAADQTAAVSEALGPEARITDELA